MMENKKQESSKSTHDIIINYACSYEKFPVEDSRIVRKRAPCSMNVMNYMCIPPHRIDTNCGPLQLSANLRID